MNKTGLQRDRKPKKQKQSGNYRNGTFKNKFKADFNGQSHE